MERARIEATMSGRGWLAGCDPGFRRRLLDHARSAVFPADQPVFHAGDLAGGIYGVALGGFAVSVFSAAALPAAATILRSGNWFGDGPLATDRRRKLSFRATEPSVALHLPLAAIRALRADSPEGERYFAELARINLDLAVRVVGDLLIPRTDCRIAATLLRLTRADEGERPLDPAGFRLRQAELGEMANASRRSVVRALAEFEARGWVVPGQHRIAVQDAAGLAQFAYAQAD